MKDTLVQRSQTAPTLPADAPATPIILIVEDSLSEQARLAATLIKQGYKVITATNGKQAIDILAKEKVSLIISDWRMPEISGLDLCKTIREEASFDQPYFILLTGCNSPNDLIAGMDSGADDFITKPFVTEELRVRVKAGIRIIQLQQQLEQQNRKLHCMLNNMDS